MLARRNRTDFGRRKHRHWQVKVFYFDGEVFARVYTDREKAEKYATRQRKSFAVKMARIMEVHKAT